MPRPRQNIGLYYHELSKDISQGGKVSIPKNISDWPESWKTIEYKNYKNSKKIFLTKISELNEKVNFKKLNEVVVERKSKRDFKERNYKITIEDLSILCGYSFGLNILGKNNVDSNRVYPSGGARFPLEFYLYINRGEKIERGIYHYNVLEHSLELIENLEDRDLGLFSAYDWVHDAALTIFITSIFDRNMRKYGERGYRYILLEAGHTGQNIYLNCANLNLSVCGVAGTSDKKVEEILKIDGKNETMLFTYVIG